MKKIITPLLLFLAFLAACHAPVRVQKQDGQEARIPVPAEDDAMRPNKALAFHLLHTVYAGEAAGKNILLSPLSATMALAILNNGAAGQTRWAIQRALGYEDVPIEEINKYFRKMAASLRPSKPSVAFGSADALWLRNGLPLAPAFTETIKTYYDAEAHHTDFPDPAAIARINGWCARKTHGWIPTVLHGAAPDMEMVLINVLYFKGAWKYAFNPKVTREGIFRNADKSSARIPFMHARMPVKSYANGRIAMVELPYAGDTFSMVLLLPRQEVSLADILKTLDADQWAGYMRDMRPGDVALALPRFTMAYARPLNQDLKAMGLSILFTPEADFSLMTSPATGLFVSQVIQKTFVQVSEEGTEAAAASAVTLARAAYNPAPEASFTFDRPFLCFIRDKKTGTIVFAGAVQDLKAE